MPIIGVKALTRGSEAVTREKGLVQGSSSFSVSLFLNALYAMLFSAPKRLIKAQVAFKPRKSSESRDEKRLWITGSNDSYLFGIKHAISAVGS